MGVFIFTRHGESTLNVEHRVNGDFGVPVALTDAGREAASRLGRQLANASIEVVVHTRFARTRETAAIAAPGVPLVEEPLLDDIDVGELEGCTIAEYRAWKRRHARSDRFPGGESLDDAARRYARAFRRLLERPESRILVVAHEIPVRYALNAAAGSDELDAPVHDVANATPYLFDAASLERAAARIEALVGGTRQRAQY